MTDNIVEEQIEKRKISKLSKMAFFILMGAYLLLILGLVLHNFLMTYSPLILLLSIIVSTTLSIVDLTRKDRKKWVSILTIVLNSIYVIGIFLAIVLLAKM